ncbi:MAG: SGNH/GDSL hydrolase family protein [Muribaculaceae bacterium]|nr:SGNH/GDSL hydrolase family protein [Muribaculaceae bacterium]
MKRFFIILLCAAALLACADRLIGHALQRWQDATTAGETGRLNWVLHEVEAPVVVFGTSRALHHYVPQVLSDSTGLEVANCGFEGLGIMTNYALIRFVTQRYTPQLIVYDLSYYYDLELAPATSDVSRVRRLPGLRCRDSLLSAIDPWERLRLCSRIYPYNSVVADMALNSLRDSLYYDTPEIDRGYWPQHGTLDTTTAERHRPRTDVTDPVKLALLADLIARCHDRLIICTSPAWVPGYYATEMYAPVKALAAQHGVPFLEMDCDTAFVGHPQLWDDRMHLNDTGARLFTARVAHAARQRLTGSGTNTRGISP